MTEDETTTEAAREPMKAECFCMGVGPQVTTMLRCKSEKSLEHFRNARIEFLKGLRTLIDERIEKLSRPQQKGTTVPVE